MGEVEELLWPGERARGEWAVRIWNEVSGAGSQSVGWEQDVRIEAKSVVDDDGLGRGGPLESGTWEFG